MEIPAEVVFRFIGCVHDGVVDARVWDGEPALAVGIFGLQGSQVVTRRGIGIVHRQGDDGGFFGGGCAAGLFPGFLLLQDELLGKPGKGLYLVVGIHGVPA